MGGLFGACHSLDVPLAFDTLGSPNGRELLGDPPTPEARAVSRELHRAWIRFATTGDPGWPAYHPDHQLTRVLDTTSTTARYPEQDSHHIWENRPPTPFDLFSQWSPQRRLPVWNGRPPRPSPRRARPGRNWCAGMQGPSPPHLGENRMSSASRDLMIVTADAVSSRSLPQGNLSLALAGGELIDLLTAGALTVDGERIVPGYRPTIDDPLLNEAAMELVRQAPYETISDWLWRRGDGLYATYRARLATEGVLSRERRRGLHLRADHYVLADTPDRRAAVDRLASGEPVLTALAAAVGIAADGEAEEGDGPAPDPSNLPSVDDNGVDTVLAAVHGALMELEALRQRRAIEQAAFDNIWRGN
ncbi:GPP34 family phosphoprotein [Streptomyces sp. NPDC057743]|uniref:GOLPH3/VPS74 family protein n=1 Tax=Streptomyces sp. NPDC057743 TaxID=3346236 RepID=UPI0036BFC773